MSLSEQEVADALAVRQDADKVIDRWNGLRTYYRDWQYAYEDLHRVYRNEWTMRWPDGRVTNVDPAIPNMVRLAVRDRAHDVDATPPAFMCRPEGPGDEAREKADKLERIVSSWISSNRIKGHKTQMWAMDAMGGGLAVCKVLPDFSRPAAERFPLFTRLMPQLSYPDPVFTPGPFCDSFMYAYEESRRSVEARYGVKLSWKGKDRHETSAEKVRVIEYYDDTWVLVVVEETGSPRSQTKREMVLEVRHKLDCCPVVIGTAPNLDDTYSGEFTGGLGVLDYWNRLMTMLMDDAIRKVYPERVTYNVQNPEDYGPDAEIQLESPDGRYEYIQQPNQPFSNLQILRDVSQSVRTAFMLPVSRSGDPNESIISAAGVNATQGQYMADVRAIQNSVIAPMLEAALEVALDSEEKWSPGTTKNIWSTKQGSYRESYIPGKDIAGYRHVEVRYGAMAGVDPINQGVMVMQQLGAGIVSKRDAMELSPFVEDPQRTEKRQLQELLQQAMLAGLAQQAQQGLISPYHLAMVDQAVSSDEVSLSEAIAVLVPQAPLAPPGGAVPAGPTATPGESTSPGIAGAATGPQPEQTDAQLAALLGG